MSDNLVNIQIQSIADNEASRDPQWTTSIEIGENQVSGMNEIHPNGIEHAPGAPNPHDADCPNNDEGFDVI